jgi:hypothetical protein
VSVNRGCGIARFGLAGFTIWGRAHEVFKLLCALTDSAGLIRTRSYLSLFWVASAGRKATISAGLQQEYRPIKKTRQ